jgi:hypothetical protein
VNPILIGLGVAVILALYLGLSVIGARQSSWRDVGIAWALTAVIAGVAAVGSVLIVFGLGV